MRIRFGSRKKIRFTDKKHPIKGLISVALGGIVILVLSLLLFFSSASKGNSGMAVGVIGVLELIASFVGFILAVRCFKEEDVYMTTPTIGAIVNGFLVIVFLLLYVIGAV